MKLGSNFSMAQRAIGMNGTELKATAQSALMLLQCDQLPFSIRSLARILEVTSPTLTTNSAYS